MNDILLNYGPLGVMVIGMAGVIAKLYYDNKELAKENRSLQEARLQDLKDSQAKLTEPLAALGRAIEEVGKTADKIYESEEK